MKNLCINIENGLAGLDESYPFMADDSEAWSRVSTAELIPLHNSLEYLHPRRDQATAAEFIESLEAAIALL